MVVYGRKMVNLNRNRLFFIEKRLDCNIMSLKRQFSIENDRILTQSDEFWAKTGLF